MVKALVTGGAGFIGSHLVDQLLAFEHEVIVLDNYSTGRLENLEHHKLNKNLTIVETDITNFDAILPHFAQVTWVFHMAALADIVPSIQQPMAYHNANVVGTINVLEAARLCGVKRFIYAASSSCYGIPDIYPTPESAPAHPQYPYALTKYIGERYVMHWGQVYQLPALSLRMFNVFGTRSRTSGTYGAVFGVFLAQKIAKKPFTVVGDGTQTRDFTYVSDIAEAYIKAAQSSLCNETINLGSGNTYSINQLVDLLKGDVTYIPKRPGEPNSTYADITKAKALLNWSPKISLEQGVHIMLENIDYWRQAPVWDEVSIQQATKEWFAYLGDENI